MLSAPLSSVHSQVCTLDPLLPCSRDPPHTQPSYPAHTPLCWHQPLSLPHCSETQGKPLSAPMCTHRHTPSPSLGPVQVPGPSVPPLHLLYSTVARFVPPRWSPRAPPGQWLTSWAPPTPEPCAELLGALVMVGSSREWWQLWCQGLPGTFEQTGPLRRAP